LNAAIRFSINEAMVLRGLCSAPPELAGMIEDVGRAKTLPMIRGHVELTGFRVWGSEYF